MATAICPDTSNPRLWQEALTIGECTIVLRCVRAERIALIERLLGSAMISRRWRAWRAEAVECESKPSPPQDELEAMCLDRPGLNRLERYERRALSRRKRAVESLIAIQNNTPRHPPHGGLQSLWDVSPREFVYTSYGLIYELYTIKVQFLAKRTQLLRRSASTRAFFEFARV
jgi:hypothetical protein